jgi:hypothetical protein
MQLFKTKQLGSGNSSSQGSSYVTEEITAKNPKTGEEYEYSSYPGMTWESRSRPLKPAEKLPQASLSKRNVRRRHAFSGSALKP